MNRKGECELLGPVGRCLSSHQPHSPPLPEEAGAEQRRQPPFLFCVPAMAATALASWHHPGGKDKMMWKVLVITALLQAQLPVTGAQSLGLLDPKLCYLLDGVLFIYGVIITALFLRAKFGRSAAAPEHQQGPNQLYNVSVPRGAAGGGGGGGGGGAQAPGAAARPLGSPALSPGGSPRRRRLRSTGPAAPPGAPRGPGQRAPRPRRSSRLLQELNLRGREEYEVLDKRRGLDPEMGGKQRKRNPQEVVYNALQKDKMAEAYSEIGIKSENQRRRGKGHDGLYQVKAAVPLVCTVGAPSLGGAL
uniref:T-cell surface glycoprotein CD3 zeta chain n=1 Tax=Canis lupus dingo TaxID=286419 RepID=A0A8C0LDS4_CANLU